MFSSLKLQKNENRCFEKKRATDLSLFQDGTHYPLFACMDLCKSPGRALCSQEVMSHTVKTRQGWKCDLCSWATFGLRPRFSSQSCSSFTKCSLQRLHKYHTMTWRTRSAFPLHDTTADNDKSWLWLGWTAARWFLSPIKFRLHICFPQIEEKVLQSLFRSPEVGFIQREVERNECSSIILCLLYLKLDVVAETRSSECPEWRDDETFHQNRFILCCTWTSQAGFPLKAPCSRLLSAPATGLTRHLLRPSAPALQHLDSYDGYINRLRRCCIATRQRVFPPAPRRCGRCVGASGGLQTALRPRPRGIPRMNAWQLYSAPRLQTNNGSCAFPGGNVRVFTRWQEDAEGGAGGKTRVGWRELIHEGNIWK